MQRMWLTSYKQALTQHIRALHEGIKYLCDFQSSRNSGLRQHIKNIHEERKYQCGLCEYKANNNHNLRKHYICVDVINSKPQAQGSSENMLN